jgi:hypothetical protein
MALQRHLHLAHAFVDEIDSLLFAATDAQLNRDLIGGFQALGVSILRRRIHGIARRL